MNFRTTAAYISGAICGRMWMPNVMAGKPVNIDIRGTFERFTTPASFEDCLQSILMHEGGDFQNAAFSEDSVIRIERRAIDAPGKYRVHVKEIPVSRFGSDYIHADTFACDFFGDD